MVQNMFAMQKAAVVQKLRYQQITSILVIISKECFKKNLAHCSIAEKQYTIDIGP